MKLQKGLEQLAPATDLDLDPGIRRAVLVLRSARIATFESCQGGPGHAFPDPTIKFHGSAWEGYRALAVAMEHDLPVLRMQHVYGVVNGQLEGAVVGIGVSHHGLGAGIKPDDCNARNADALPCPKRDIASRYCCLRCTYRCRDKRSSYWAF